MLTLKVLYPLGEESRVVTGCVCVEVCVTDAVAVPERAQSLVDTTIPPQLEVLAGEMHAGVLEEESGALHHTNPLLAVLSRHEKQVTREEAAIPQDAAEVIKLPEEH